MSKSGPEKLNMKSPDITSENVEKIGELFPNAITELHDEDGKIRKGIDFDLLRQELSGDYVEGREERYEFTWVGKKQSIVEANTPIQKTLRPCMEESKNWETTKNIYIEGDNLEALKLLQESYLNSVKLIYIDPPYNTGNDFIYNDNFAIDSEEYDEGSGVIDESGNRLIKNSKERGRYHSDWCSMLYPRLKLAHNLLLDDGVIFVSIDDNEEHNLRKMMDEVFGEENLRAEISWQKKYSVSNNFVGIASIRDYVLVYAKSDKFQNGLFPRTEESIERYINPDNDPRGPWKPVDYWNQASPERRPNLVYDITNPNTGEVISPSKKAWKYQEETHKKHLKENRLWWGIDGKNSVPALKLFLSEVREGLIPHNWWPHETSGHTDEAKKELERLFGVAPFDTPKPVRLIKKIIQVANVGKKGIIIDFFSGSGTTAQAVIEMNAIDNNDRRFIMIQIPELCDEKSEAFKSGFKNISDIGKERIRRAGEKIKGEIEKAKKQPTIDGEQKTFPDIGFRVFKIDDTNMKDVYYSASEYSQETIEGLIDNVKEGRTDLDLLYQVLIDWGLPLDLPHEIEKIGNFHIHIVDKNALVACFDANIPDDIIRKIATKKPLRAVFRDGSFKSSPGKLNIEGIFKTIAPDTSLRVI